MSCKLECGGYCRVLASGWGFGATNHGAKRLEIPSLNNAIIYYLGTHADNTYTNALPCVMDVVYVQLSWIEGWNRCLAAGRNGGLKADAGTEALEPHHDT
jgi:hypothetical protein